MIDKRLNYKKALSSCFFIVCLIAFDLQFTFLSQGSNYKLFLFRQNELLICVWPFSRHAIGNVDYIFKQDQILQMFKSRIGNLPTYRNIIDTNKSTNSKKNRCRVQYYC